MTSAPAISTVIYHEQPFGTPDGNRIAIYRTQYVRRWVPGELLVYDIENYRTASLLQAGSGGGQDWVSTAAWSGVLFASAASDVGRPLERSLWRVDLNTLQCEPMPEGLPGFGTVSADLQYGLTSDFLHERQSDGRRETGVFRVHLQSGEQELIYRSRDIGNPHLAFHADDAGRILVQENRGWVYDEWGNFEPAEGSTIGLCTFAADGSDRREFPVGGHHTPRTTGHECWIAGTDRVHVTLSAPYNDGTRCGTVLEVSHEWDKPRVVFETPYVWNHVSASRCGKYFVADCYDLPHVPLLVGCIVTGKTSVNSWLSRAVAVADSNVVLFDPANQFHGCIPGIHEVLRRQGLMQNILCLNPHDTLSPGQSEELDRIYRAYPFLQDDEWVQANRDTWVEVNISTALSALEKYTVNRAYFFFFINLRFGATGEVLPHLLSVRRANRRAQIPAEASARVLMQ